MKSTKYLLAATLAVGMLNYSLRADDTTATTQPADKAAMNDVNNADTSANSNAGMSNNATASNNMDENGMTGVKDTHWINNVREQIREIVNASLTKNDLEAIRNRLTVADQKRMGDISDEDSKDLNMLIKDIDQKWKDKYGHDFDINTKMALADPFVRIDSINKAQMASDTNDNKTENMEMASVTVAADETAKKPEVNLTFVREHMSWKLQLPASVDGAMLKTNLMTQLQALNNDSANWPADENDAYRAVTHCILMGIAGNTNAGQAGSSTGM